MKIVPSVCGNVARITDTLDRPDMHAAVKPAPVGPVRRWMSGTKPSAAAVNAVPEPGTLWIVIAALAVVAFVFASRK